MTAIEENDTIAVPPSTGSRLAPGDFVELSRLRTVLSMISRDGANLARDFLICTQVGAASETETADWKLQLRTQTAFPFVQHAFSFGVFRLLPAQRLLLQGGERLGIGSRAFDILAMLVEHAGEVVCKAELMRRAWPNVNIEENNLKVQVSCVRRIIGNAEGGRPQIVAVPGRGYAFVAPVRVEVEPFA